MKRTFFALILLAVSYGMAGAQTLDEVLAGYFKAIGQDKLNTVQTLTTTGTFARSGMETNFTVFLKRPEKMRVEVDIQGLKLIQVYNGGTGWMINPFTGSQEPQDFSGVELKGMKEQADMDGFLYNWADKGHKAELVGKEDLEGTPVYKIKLTQKEGDVTHYYIDADSYILIKTSSKIKIEEAESEIDNYYGNYKEVNGIMMAFTYETRKDGEIMSTVTMKEVKLDEPIGTSVFEKPQK